MSAPKAVLVFLSYLFHLVFTRSQLKTLQEFAAVLGEQDEGVRDVRRLLQLLQHGYGVSAVDAGNTSSAAAAANSSSSSSSSWVQFDPSVVRGLAYYTGLVFEASDRQGQLRAICGGGRYDRLLQSLGGPAVTAPVPAVGFGFGDAVIVELLKSKQLLPDTEAAPIVDVVVYAMVAAGAAAKGTTSNDSSGSSSNRNITDNNISDDAIVGEDLRLKGLQVAAQLRAADSSLRVEVVLESQGRKLKWALQRAERQRAPLLVLLAEDEHAQGTAVLRDLRSRQQAPVPYTALLQRVQEALLL